MFKLLEYFPYCHVFKAECKTLNSVNTDQLNSSILLLQTQIVKNRILSDSLLGNIKTEY